MLPSSLRRLSRLGLIDPAAEAELARAEAERCLYCADAPCIKACPTEIDIPTFIKKIASGNVRGSAKTIFDQNLLGYSCSRVCPVEELRVTVHDGKSRPVDGKDSAFFTAAPSRAARQAFSRSICSRSVGGASTGLSLAAGDSCAVPAARPVTGVTEVVRLPDGTVHDGCVRADDTGGGIKVHKLDFFVVSYGNFRTLLQEVWGVNWVTPYLEAPRCQYLRNG